MDINDAIPDLVGRMAVNFLKKCEPMESFDLQVEEGVTLSKIEISYLDGGMLMKLFKLRLSRDFTTGNPRRRDLSVNKVRGDISPATIAVFKNFMKSFGFKVRDENFK